jgi:hypothetical protein
MIVSGVLRTRNEPVPNLWTTNANYARPIFPAIMARDWFFHKTTSNQQTSTDKLVPFRDVLEGITSRFKMTYKLNEHTTTDGVF